MITDLSSSILRRSLMACALALPCAALCAGQTAPAAGSAAGDAEAQDRAAAMDILHHAAANYRNLTSYKLQITVHTLKGSEASERRLTETGVGAAKYRLSDDDPKGTLIVGDGQTEWTFDPAASEYAKAPEAAAPETPAGQLRELDQHVSDAGIAREDLFTVEGGKTIPVYVVEVERDQWPAATIPGAQLEMISIDEKTFVVYSTRIYSHDASVNMVYSIVDTNKSEPASLFTFAPPESAHAASSEPARAAPSTSTIGIMAPDFTLPDTSGKNVTLSALRGKVVLVDFWATWCPPCRAELPEVQKIHEEFQDKGVVVLGLNSGEEPDVVTQFTKKQGYTFTVLLGAEPETTIKYFLDGYPTTIVIGRDGRVTYRASGNPPSGELRAALEAALGATP